MAKSRVYLAVDLGASSGRVVAGRFDGRRLTLEEVHRFANGPVQIQGSYHWNVIGLFCDLKAGLARAAATYGRAVASVGVDTWGVDYGYIDRQGRLIGNPYAYRDGRTTGMEAAACRRVPRRRIYEATGIQFMFFNTLNQVLSEVVSRSPVLDVAHRLLFMPDLLNYWLTGIVANEYTIASTSQMSDPRTRDWARPLLRAMGIPTRLLAHIVEPGAVLGPLKSDVAAETGLAGVRLVAPGTHDTASAVAAVPASGSDHAYLSSGTWSLMGVEAPRPVIDDLSYRLSFTNEGGVENTVRLLKNICGLWLEQECRRVWAAKGETLDYGRLRALAAKAPAFASLVDPDDPSFAAPGDMPARIRAFCARTGQKAPATPGAIERCILESLALKYRVVFGRLEALTGRRIETLHIVGGGTQCRMLNQFAANALGRRVVTGPVEATAAGNILMQMKAARDIRSLAEGRAIVRASFDTAEYTPQDTPAWDEAAGRFEKLLA